MMELLVQPSTIFTIVITASIFSVLGYLAGKETNEESYKKGLMDGADEATKMLFDRYYIVDKRHKEQVKRLGWKIRD